MADSGWRRVAPVVYQAAQADLLSLAERGVLNKGKKGKQTIFRAPSDFSARLLKLEKEADA
jgi:hypothetical protein